MDGPFLYAFLFIYRNGFVSIQRWVEMWINSELKRRRINYLCRKHVWSKVLKSDNGEMVYDEDHPDIDLVSMRTDSVMTTTTNMKMDKGIK